MTKTRLRQLQDLATAPTPTAATFDLELVVARDLLIEALHTLNQHRECLILVGAQAVHERTKSVTIAPSVATKDADLCIDPALLASQPLLLDTMINAGFTPALASRPGIWGKSVDVVGFTAPVQVDLIVPEALAGSGTRSARLGAHGKHAASRAEGLELAIVDNDVMQINALDGSGRKAGPVKVAGTAALLCAKSFKLAERVMARDGGGRDRVKAKDAGDVWRVFCVADPEDVRERFERFERDGVIGAAIAQGRRHLLDLFGANGVGAGLAAEDLQVQIPAAQINELIHEWMAAFVG
jgi:hypothetical protein